MVMVILAFSCENKKRDRVDMYTLKKSESQLSFSLDNNTKSDILALFLYKDEDKTEYLTFQNPGQNEILFYNMDSRLLEFKVTPQYEGNNGVGTFLGYYVHNLDSIFLTIVGIEEIALIDRNAIVKDKYPFDITRDGITLSAFYSTSYRYHPILLFGKKLCIVPGCNRWVDRSPVCATIDLTDGTVEALQAFNYPSFPGADNKAKKASAEIYVSRCFNGKQFVYSFYFDEDIYVVSPDHETIERVKVKSNYINKIGILDDYGNLTYEDVCENPNYGNMFYDEYRDVYYRIAYPETEIEKGIRGMELQYYGRKNFSIIILDKDFNIIGETMFPDYTYNSNVMFIREDGLYISSSHYLNPEYSDDVLSFRRFDLVKK
jgi:hypothetical protein